jgi:ubiquinone biosynthesis monooxygenase Coq7
MVPADETHLDDQERKRAGALMRVNHVGEVCAQALYTAQALATRDPALRAHFARAAAEETDHLAWTADRLSELGDRPSLLNPLWYAGAFGLGLLAGRMGDRLSLGFVVETERQVEAHLQGHLDRLPPADHASRAIVVQMKDDESAHAAQALRLAQPTHHATLARVSLDIADALHFAGRIDLAKPWYAAVRDHDKGAVAIRYRLPVNRSRRTTRRP